MKHAIYFTIILVVGLTSCNHGDDPSQIVLETTGFADSTKIYLMNVAEQTSDSGYIINNNLAFSVDINEPTHFLIRPVIKSRADVDVKYFWKENRRMTIIAEKGKIKNAIVEGSDIQLQADAIEAGKAPLIHINDSLLKEYRSLPVEEKEQRTALRANGKEIVQAINDVEINYIKNNPDELFSAITLKQLMTYKIPKVETKVLYEGLSAENKSTKYGIAIKKYLDLNRDLEIGDKAVDFQLPDIDGNLVGLSNFKGKYILLDFWASGCGPCRMENPNLLRNYKAYREKGFEIIGVSYDKKREDWVNAVKKDSMIWTTVCDLQGSDGDVFMTYGVYYFPTYFLIDPDGAIIDKYQGRGQLDKRMKKIFPG